MIKQVDTSAWSINDELWVNGVGALTNVRPTSGLIQKIGRVVRVNASTGEILVLGAGRTNDVPFPLFVDHANQRVGIGTASPASLLEVSSATERLLRLRLKFVFRLPRMVVRGLRLRRGVSCRFILRIRRMAGRRFRRLLLRLRLSRLAVWVVWVCGRMMAHRCRSV